MAPAAIDEVNPVSNFRFALEIEGSMFGWFTECNGLTIERDTTPQPEGGVNDYTHQLPGRIKYTRITLKRGLADDSLWDWFQEGLYDANVKRQNISIVLYSVDRLQAKRWNLSNAYPVKWTGPDFKSDGNQVAVESLELVHHGMEMTAWTAV